MSTAGRHRRVSQRSVALRTVVVSVPSAVAVVSAAGTASADPAAVVSVRAEGVQPGVQAVGSGAQPAPAVQSIAYFLPESVVPMAESSAPAAVVADAAARPVALYTPQDNGAVIGGGIGTATGAVLGGVGGGLAGIAIGAIAGGLIGSVPGAAIGAVIGGVIGAGLGGTAGAGTGGVAGAATGAGIATNDLAAFPYIL
ncbi:hypothetical protein [Nocardia yamanashiensis]|uniref:hypothetical protein n=1 Tax=Nocardia yamanashiensis TaxID=209247 RepID=UPI000AED8EA7|nr:hypothetical protein [Nocardia yamanashiensis]